MVSERYWVAEIYAKLFWMFLSNPTSLRHRFVFKTNGRISSITSYKDHIYIYIYTSYFRRGGKSVVLEYTNGVRSERIIKYYYRLNRDHFSML